MINSYCENLENMFAEMVHYGVLKEEDAQCFSVTSHIENGAFFLAAGALLLAFLSTFVFKGVVQYLKDEKEHRQQMKELERSTTAIEESCHSSDDGDVADGGFSGTIRPVPILFTDTFRWMLKPDASLPSSSRALFASETDHWSLPEATAVASGIPNEQMAKGTYVRDLDSSQGKGRVGSPQREKSLASMSDDSFASKQASLGPGKRLTFDDHDGDLKMPARSVGSFSQHKRPQQQNDQCSVASQMESTNGSFKDEASEAESLAYSLPSSAGHSFLFPPPPDLESKQSSKASDLSSSRKPPPPSAYRLSARQSTTTASPFAAYFEQHDGKHVTPKRSNLKAPPPGSLKRAPQPKAEESDSDSDDFDQGEFTHVSVDDSQATGNDYYFEESDSRRDSSSAFI